MLVLHRFALLDPAGEGLLGRRLAEEEEEVGFEFFIFVFCFQTYYCSFSSVERELSNIMRKTCALCGERAPKHHAQNLCLV